jgi:tetratricopeptide (TPR) repeat protein
MTCVSLRRWICAAAWAAAAGAASAQPVEFPRTTVRDPHYGEALFQYYQQRSFDTVVRLMVAQHFDRLSVQADEAEVLRGALLLSFGLHEEAARLFERLIERGAPLAVRDRAWFYLAKIRYQRGLYAQAEAAAARIQGALPPDLDEERSLLLGNLATVRGDFAGVAKVLAALERRGRAGPFARFNLGVALIRSGESARGREVLDALGRAPAENEEAWTLRDKANVALGFAALQAEEPQVARAALERVRLSSLQANQALLGFGWAAASNKQMQAALVPWTELESRDPSDGAVLEARLALPWAYSQLGAPAQALERYERALTEYTRESARIDESIAAIRAGKLLDELLERNPDATDEMGWFWSIGRLPSLPHAGHLTLVLAQHEFQEAFKNYRDLRFVARNLRERGAAPPVLRDMLAHRREAFAARMPAATESARVLGGALLAAETPRQEFSEAVAQARAQADGVALADEAQREQLEQLAQWREQVGEGGTDPARTEDRKRLRRLDGALAWQLAREYPIRIWNVTRDFQQYDKGLADARKQRASLLAAMRDQPARFDAYAQRIDTAERQLAGLAPRVAQLIAEQQAVVQDLAVAELTRQKERLADFTAQARFAVAQLYERAGIETQPGARDGTVGGRRGR